MQGGKKTYFGAPPPTKEGERGGGYVERKYDGKHG